MERTRISRLDCTMNSAKRLLLSATALILLSGPLFLAGCTCGFDCSSDDDDTDQTALLDLFLSDSLPEDLKEVVIEVESITLTRDEDDGGNVVIESFIFDSNSPVDSFQINLLEYPGVASLQIVEDLEVAAGDYNSIQIAINTAGGDSYVLQNDDQQFDLLVTNNRLSLEGVRLTENDESYTVEFELARALQFEAASSNYRLSRDGIRVVDNTRAARIIGAVDADLFEAETACAGKDDPDLDNRVYLYEGRDLGVDNLTDVFRSDSANAIPSGAIAPYAVDNIVLDARTGVWSYTLAYLPPGDYTLAFTCNSEDDDPVDYDGLSIPLPSDQLYQFTLSSREIATCNLAVTPECVDD